MLVGDFNGDGKLDLAVPNGEDAVAILLGGGGGTFQDPVRYHVANRPDSVGAGTSMATATSTWPWVRKEESPRSWAREMAHSTPPRTTALD